MKDSHIILPLAACVICASALSCAKSVTTVPNESARLFIDAWISVHHLDTIGPVAHGIYITEDIPGTGETIETDGNSYFMADYYIRQLSDSVFKEYSYESVAKQLNVYDSTYTYHPKVFRMAQRFICQGFMDIINGGTDSKTGKVYPPMRVGGTRCAIVPGWLTATDRYYDTREEYINNVTGTDYIYKMELKGRSTDIFKTQVDSIEAYMDRMHYEKWDTTCHSGFGFYFFRDEKREARRRVTPRHDYKFPSDTTIYINYVGRRLDGRVFDTNIADTAKIWGLYSDGATYSPQEVKFASDSTALTMGSSSVISGFSQTIWHMHPFESAEGIFTSKFGYGVNGSGKRIPGYEPLVFEIDIVAKP